MIHEFKVSDASKHVWTMSIVNSKSFHCVTVTSPKGIDYSFIWRDGELIAVSARGKIFRTDGKCFKKFHSFREVFSRIPMWILQKMDFYYKVHIAE